jgi:hypothetical protein
VTKQTSKKPVGYEKFVLEGYSGKGGETYFSKVSQTNSLIGISYEEKVNREREKEGLKGNFEAKESPYEFVTSGVRKKGDQYYLFFFPQSEAKDFDKVLVGIQEGSAYPQVVDVEAIADWMPPERPASSSGRQGLSEGNEVKPRTVSFASIAAIKVDGESYVLSDIDHNRLQAFELAFAG